MHIAAILGHFVTLGTIVSLQKYRVYGIDLSFNKGLSAIQPTQCFPHKRKARLHAPCAELLIATHFTLFLQGDMLTSQSQLKTCHFHETSRYVSARLVVIMEALLRSNAAVVQRNFRLPYFMHFTISSQPRESGMRCGVQGVGEFSSQLLCSSCLMISQAPLLLETSTDY